MNTEMQRRALAARDAHLALSNLKRLIEEATQTTHELELEAFHQAISAKAHDDISSNLRAVRDRLGSNDFAESLRRARQSLLMAMS